MRKDDIRFNGQNVTLKHHSSRGRVTRNAGNFTRGSQLVSHEFMMTFAGVKIPVLAWLLVFIVILNIALWLRMAEHEIGLCLMRMNAGALLWVGFDPERIMNLTLPSGAITPIEAARISYHPAVAEAWDKATRAVLGSAVVSAFIAAPLTIWFVDFSKKRGQSILEERHERGAMLVSREVLTAEIRAHNSNEVRRELARLDPSLTLEGLKRLPPDDRAKVRIHRPYTLAGIPYPYRLEQSHTMLIGTTGSGKTTQLRSLVSEARERGHRAVIFDLTGAFVEAFFNPETDTILNPMDDRCPAWTIFNDCSNYAEFLNAAEALIPADGGREMFWENAARTLFVEMCMVLRSRGECSNQAIADQLMTADLKDLHSALERTVAGPLTSTQAARMAESVRSTFNTHAHVLRFLPDKGPQFSIVDWITGEFKPGSILFITSAHADLTLNRPMLTLWMNIAVNSLMKLERTRDLRTWFHFDEVHALHRLPAIENGLQTARGFGGAFVLGIHSFEKLAETYGHQGAVNLAALARTKLILATAEMETATKCAEFIGNREVRQMDEAYSYGYNNTRDAATLTPRKEIEPLVIPDDITNLPSMYGFVKFPDGFPAARIKLQWRDYPEVANGFHRKKDPESVLAQPGKKGADGEGELVDEATDGHPLAPEEKGRTEPLTQAERDAEAMEIAAPQPEARPAVARSSEEGRGATNDNEGAKGEQGRSGQGTSGADARSYTGAKSALRVAGPDQDERNGKSAGDGSRAAGRAAAMKFDRAAKEERQESQIERETREGAGIDERRSIDHGLGDDGDYGLGD